MLGYRFGGVAPIVERGTVESEAALANFINLAVDPLP